MRHEGCLFLRRSSNYPPPNTQFEPGRWYRINLWVRTPADGPTLSLGVEEMSLSTGQWLPPKCVKKNGVVTFPSGEDAFIGSPNGGTGVGNLIAQIDNVSMINYWEIAPFSNCTEVSP